MIKDDKLDVLTQRAQIRRRRCIVAEKRGGAIWRVRMYLIKSYLVMLTKMEMWSYIHIGIRINIKL